jgi:hypothetical protein
MEDIQRVLREAHIAGLRAVKNGISGVVVKPVGLEFKFIKQTQLGFFQEEGFTIDYEGQTARRSFTDLYYAKAFQKEAIKYGFTVNLVS